MDSIWSMHQKRFISMGEVQKYKVWLNAHGGQLIHGVSYWETFAPMVMWTTIQLVLSLIIIHGWESQQLDFMLAYPQADIEEAIYMKLSKGFELSSVNTF